MVAMAEFDCMSRQSTRHDGGRRAASAHVKRSRRDVRLSAHRCSRAEPRPHPLRDGAARLKVAGCGRAHGFHATRRDGSMHLRSLSCADSRLPAKRETPLSLHPLADREARVFLDEEMNFSQSFQGSRNVIEQNASITLNSLASCFIALRWCRRSIRGSSLSIEVSASPKRCVEVKLLNTAPRRTLKPSSTRTIGPGRQGEGEQRRHRGNATE